MKCHVRKSTKAFFLLSLLLVALGSSVAKIKAEFDSPAELVPPIIVVMGGILFFRWAFSEASPADKMKEAQGLLRVVTGDSFRTRLFDTTRRSKDADVIEEEFVRDEFPYVMAVRRMMRLSEGCERAQALVRNVLYNDQKGDIDKSELEALELEARQKQQEIDSKLLKLKRSDEYKREQAFNLIRNINMQ